MKKLKWLIQEFSVDQGRNHKMVYEIETKDCGISRAFVRGSEILFKRDSNPRGLGRMIFEEANSPFGDEFMAVLAL